MLEGQILRDMKAHGYTFHQIATAIGVGESTLRTWLDHHVAPRHVHGEALIMLYRTSTGKFEPRGSRCLKG
jgi:phage antirepressor YoqD-like protein